MFPMLPECPLLLPCLVIQVSAVTAVLNFSSNMLMFDMSHVQYGHFVVLQPHFFGGGFRLNPGPTPALNTNQGFTGEQRRR